MVKWISAVLVILFGIVFTFILYLSTIGIETNSFNSFVQNKLKNYNSGMMPMNEDEGMNWNLGL